MAAVVWAVKVGLLGFECRCGYVYCSRHRHASDHSCAFDYATFDKANLAKNNAKVCMCVRVCGGARVLGCLVVEEGVPAPGWPSFPRVAPGALWRGRVVLVCRRQSSSHVPHSCVQVVAAKIDKL